MLQDSDNDFLNLGTDVYFLTSKINELQSRFVSSTRYKIFHK